MNRAKPLAASLKTAVKWIGLLLVGSACPLAWSIVTDGGAVSIVHVNEAGDWSTLPASSDAVTWKVWLPSARPL